MDTMTQDAATRLARRYPRRRRSRWWIPVAVGLVALGSIWLAWAGLYGATGTVAGRVDAFDVRSDTLIQVTVTIDRPDPGLPASCLLYAQAVTYDRVGETTVRVPAGGSGLTILDIPLRTFKRATTAAVENCRTTP